MAKHYTPKQRRTRKAMLAGAATAGVAGTLALVQGVDVGNILIDLTAEVVPSTSCAAATPCVIGIGGRGDATSTNIPAKLSRTVYPTGDTYVPVLYPASYDLGGSRDIGVPILDGKIPRGATSPSTSVVGYSEGTLVAEQERRDLQALPAATAPDPNKLTFTQVASPFAGNGGIFARFDEIPTFLIVDNMGPAEPTRYETTYVVNEYDPYGDFPAYFNPLSLANTALAIEYAHPDVYYNGIDPAPGGTEMLGGQPYIDTHTTDGREVTDTYYLYKNDELPLLAPVRQAAAAANITQYVEPELDLVEPTLRVLIDAGYTDRTNADPVTPTRFSLITPPQNIIGAAAALPGAVQEGIGNFQGDISGNSQASKTTKAPAVSAPALPKLDLPKLDPPKPTLPKLDPPNLPTPPKPKPPTTPAIDAVKLDPPKRPTPNLGLLGDKPKVLAGNDGSATNRPSFGGGRPAGGLSGALKKLGGLGDKPASTSP